MGVMHLECAGIAEDVQKGLNFLQKACDSGAFGGCVNLAENYE
nr:hypothetical protein [uncultured Campylobacter sp.]